MTDAVADTAAAADDCSRQQSAVYRTTTNPTKLTTFRHRDEKRKLTSTLQPSAVDHDLCYEQFPLSSSCLCAAYSATTYLLCSNNRLLIAK